MVAFKDCRKILMVFVLLISLPAGLYATQKNQSEFNLWRTDQQQSYSDSQTDWQRYKSNEQAKFTKLKAEVLQKWDHYYQSNKKVWVDYAADLNSLGRVDFETGELKVEALIPVDTSANMAQHAVNEKLQALLQKEDASGKPILEDLLPSEKNRDVADNKVIFSATDVIVGTDGVERQKVEVTLQLVPDHVQKLAKRYLPIVIKESKKHGVEPALVLAVIHSESYFNPMARSHVPAFGLMQIVPRFAGKEAYQNLYGEEKLPSPGYLYHPGNNIELGVTYLDLLQHKYFPNISDLDEQRYVVICSYNWGPSAMAKRLLPKVSLEQLSTKESYTHILARLPKETHDYLKRVEERRKKYLGEIEKL